MRCKKTIQRENMKKLIFIFTLFVSCNGFADEQAELAKKLGNIEFQAWHYGYSGLSIEV